MVSARLLIFDYATFFRLHYVPNHDMYQGAPFFMTSMHSLRMQGDIVWWNPVSFNGYAQYYQSFLGPLAPTPGHVTFMLWAEGVRGLNALGIAVPEYFQYLVFNYVVLPFLTCFALALLLSLIYRRRATVLLMVIAYTFSNIGLWTSAWFYFQESFTVFFLLAALIAYLKRPTPRLLSVLVAAGLIQLASSNYWTLYNSPFVVFLVAGYGVTYPNQVRRACLRTREIIHRHKRTAWAVGGLTAITALLWIVLIGSIVVGQSNNYYRRGEDEKLSVAPIATLNTAPPVDFRTWNLFTPDIHASTTAPYNRFLTMHSAGYIGLFLLPLLVILLLYRWRRVERWLLILTVASLTIVMATPVFLWLWKTIPFMNHIRHFVRFYTSYWRLGLILLGGASLDYVLTADLEEHERRTFRISMAVLGGLSLITMMLSGVILPPTLGVMGLFSLVASVLVLQLIDASTTGQRLLMVGLFILFSFADLSRYFVVVNHYDNDFTADRWAKVERPLPRAVRAVFSKPMPIPQASHFVESVHGYIPVPNDFWPLNNYILHKNVKALTELPKGVMLETWTKQDSLVQFYKPDQIKYVPDQKSALAMAAVNFDGSLLIEHDSMQPTYTASPTSAPAAFGYQKTMWQYNLFGFQVDIPQNGWLSIGQMYDPAWRVMLDDKRVNPSKANFVRQAVPVSTGHHSITMDYQPLARRLYWPASYLLELTLAALAVIGFGGYVGSPPVPGAKTRAFSSG
jgi:hypothetical protein